MTDSWALTRGEGNCSHISDIFPCSLSFSSSWCLVLQNALFEELIVTFFQAYRSFVYLVLLFRYAKIVSYCWWSAFFFSSVKGNEVGNATVTREKIYFVIKMCARYLDARHACKVWDCLLHIIKSSIVHLINSQILLLDLLYFFKCMWLSTPNGLAIHLATYMPLYIQM